MNVRLVITKNETHGKEHQDAVYMARMARLLEIQAIKFERTPPHSMKIFEGVGDRAAGSNFTPTVSRGGWG